MKRMALTLVVLGGALFGYSLVWGEEYGAALDSTEQQAMTETFQYALEQNRTNEASAWVNPDTGRSGTVVPVNTFQNTAGEYCREFITTIIIGGVEEQGYGTACRQPDGTWMVVPSAGAADSYPVVVEKVIEKHYIYPYGLWNWHHYHPYYYYPGYSPRIFFSFNIVHFVGTRQVKAHHHKVVKDLRSKHPDGIIRSHRGSVRSGGRDFHGRRDFRHAPEERVIRRDAGGGRDFHGRRDFRHAPEERVIRRDAGGGRDFHGRRDLRGAPEERMIRRGAGGGGRDFHGRRDLRGVPEERMVRRGDDGDGRSFRGDRNLSRRSDSDGSRRSGGGQRSFGGRPHDGGRTGRR